ncbi:MAG: DUF4270 domain-containing protein [Bacteroidota bacterium]
MKHFKIASKNIALFIVLLSLCIACDRDFTSIDSDIINVDVATNFDTESQQYDVTTYTDALGPVQTNALPINYIGVYNDPFYGSTTNSFVTQLSSSILNPDFGENVELDSVVLYIPYFSNVTGFDDNNIVEYDLDSVFGSEPFRLSLYESNHFLRDFDPNSDFDTPQAYFSNQSASTSEPISDSSLEGVLIHQEDEFVFSNETIILTNSDGDISLTSAPGIRILLDTMFWQQKIIDMEGEPELSNSNNFNDYFRGIYFKAEPINGTGSLAALDLALANSSITLHYTRDPFTEGADREQSTYELRFNGNRVNFFQNNFNVALQDGDPVNGDSRLYLKGGQGAIANIELFDGFNTDDDDDTQNTFEAWREEFVEIDENGKFVSSKRLINEANIVFYVDQNVLQGEEPDRIYLYDMDNNRPLIDYSLDFQNSTLPLVSIPNHLGILQREGDEADGQGIKYKMRITTHINNLLTRDSTNVKLGLAVSGNVNLEGGFFQRLEQTPDDSEKRIPISSIISPRGTVLHGNNTEDESRRVYLEIFYTEPNN